MKKISKKPQSSKLIRSLVALALVTVVGAVLWQHGVFATTESSGATTEKQQLAQLQTRASTEISRRIASLNALSPLVEKLANATPTQQKAYRTAVANEIKALQQSSATINGDATLASAKADTQKLTTEYDAFMVLVPKTWLIITADWQQVQETKLSTYANKIQDRLNAASNAGKDISAAQITLNDLQAHIDAAKQLSDDVAKAVPETQLGQYNANHAVLVSHYNKLKSAGDNLSAALTDAKTLLSEVQAF